MRQRSQSIYPVLLLALTSAACHPGQVILYVDTDAPTKEQLLDPGNAERLSEDAFMDTLQVRALDAAGNPTDWCQINVRANAPWPRSFGVPRSAAPVRLQLQLFRGELARRAVENTTGVECAMTVPLQTSRSTPDPSATIDRIVELPQPSILGTRALRVVLSLVCINRPPSAGSERTCVDADNLSVPYTVGVLDSPEPPPPSVAGTSPLAKVTDCGDLPPGPGDLPPGPEPSSIACIKGGFLLLGDPGQPDQGADPQRIPATPLIPVRVAPFFLDKTEFSRARAQQLDPTLDDNMVLCGGAASPDLRLPLRCLTQDQANHACTVAGGRLPNEAEWEFAARGRGQRWRYAYGFAEPGCCGTALNGEGACGAPLTEPLPIGSAAEAQGCMDPLDTTAQGIRDLTGNVSEYVADRLASYTHPCWQVEGVRDASPCRTSMPNAAVRGGNFSLSARLAQSALRRTASPSETLGFRCAYPGSR